MGECKSKMCCPCCGQILPVISDLMVDEATGVIIRDGIAVDMSKSLFCLFEQLLSASPKVVTRDALYSGMYWRRSENEEPQPRIIDVYISKLRNAIAPLGFEVIARHGRGYLLRDKQGGVVGV